MNPAGEGSKAAFQYMLDDPGRRGARRPPPPEGATARLAAARSAPASSRHSRIASPRPTSSTPSGFRRAPPTDERRVLRQGYAGLLWSKQFYHFVTQHWLEGDPAQPTPPESRTVGPQRASGPTCTTGT